VSEQFLELYVEGCQIEQVGSGFEVDKEIDIAVVIVLSAHHAAENANIAGPVRLSEGNNLIAMSGEDPAQRRARLKPGGSICPDQPRDFGLAPADRLRDLLLGETAVGRSANCLTQGGAGLEA
jgi:hypothetical protein